MAVSRAREKSARKVDTCVLIVLFRVSQGTDERQTHYTHDTCIVCPVIRAQKDSLIVSVDGLDDRIPNRTDCPYKWFARARDVPKVNGESKGRWITAETLAFPYREANEKRGVSKYILVDGSIGVIGCVIERTGGVEGRT